MEVDQLDEAVGILQEIVGQFPVGAQTVDDFTSIEDKIENLRKSLVHINSRYITLKAVVEGMSVEQPDDLSYKTFDKLNISTTNSLLNSQALKMCTQSKAIKDIVYNDVAPELKEKTQNCLAQLFMMNDRISSKNNTKMELIKQLNKLQDEKYQQIFEYQEFLKAVEAKKQEAIQRNDPNLFHRKEKIDKSLNKINIMKKLMTNLVASMSQDLYKNRELIDILFKHKNLLTFDDLKDEIMRESSDDS